MPSQVEQAVPAQSPWQMTVPQQTDASFGRGAEHESPASWSLGASEEASPASVVVVESLPGEVSSPVSRVASCAGVAASSPWNETSGTLHAGMGTAIRMAPARELAVTAAFTVATCSPAGQGLLSQHERSARGAQRIPWPRMARALLCGFDVVPRELPPRERLGFSASPWSTERPAWPLV